MTTPAFHHHAALDELRVTSDRRLIRALLLTISIPASIFAAIDLMGVQPGETSIESRVVGRILSLAVPLVGLWLLQRSHTREALSRTTFVITLASVPVLLALQLQQPRGSPIVLPTLLLILAVMYVALPNSLARQALPPLLLSASYIGLRVWWLNGQSEAGLAADLVVLVFLNVIGIGAIRRRLTLHRQVSESWHQEAAAVARERQAHHLAERATQELRTLHGIIPICANCKQVRTDAGEWQQIERYVRDHSEADFSHGVCPSCAQRLYGDFVADRAGERPDVANSATKNG